MAFDNSLYEHDVGYYEYIPGKYQSTFYRSKTLILKLILENTRTVIHSKIAKLVLLFQACGFLENLHRGQIRNMAEKSCGCSTERGS